MQRLGEPGTALGDRSEEFHLFIETAPRSFEFEPAPWFGNWIEAPEVANRIPTAKFDISLADLPIPEALAGDQILDWLVRGLGGRALAPQIDLLGGRRIQCRTDSGIAFDDYLLFDGFLERLELSFSGSNRTRPRGLTGFATSTLCAADREATQQMWGQWRRCRAAEIRRRYGAGLTDPNICNRVAIPLIFNPAGRPNCGPNPLIFSDESLVYIPCDPDDPGATWWTVARMLWYVTWAALQPAPPVSTAFPRDYGQSYTSRPQSPFVLRYNWTDYRISHLNLYELLTNQLPGGGTLLEAEADNGAGMGGLSAWLRAPADVSCEMMSTLEAYTVICDRAGAAWTSQQYPDSAGAYTTVIFAVRGYTAREEQVPA